MSYLVLARKYRPQRFSDVVHQDHVTRTLANAITVGRLAHAILFSGPRGTGKTTIARILAKAMNCAQGPTPEPCNDCRSCREITGGSAADVYEIDGASNTGVENVRELRENLKYMPSHSRYKIYIIDEVHMLSTGAFNALLKTLEEPPPHVLFFFATTEPHKIPSTILSRCQRHDFKRVPTRLIAAHLSSLCNQEGRRVSQACLETIAREADGCLRDGLSLLDQVLAAADGEVDADLMRDILGTLDRQRLMDLSDALMQGNLPAILDAVDDAYNQGLDLKKLYQDLCEQFRHMLVVRSVQNVDALTLVDLPAAEIAAIGRQVAGVSAARLSQTLDVLLREDAFVRLAPQPRLAVETVLVRLLQVPPPLTIDALVARLDTLRNLIPDGGSSAVAPAPQAVPPPEGLTVPAAVEIHPAPSAEVGSPATAGADSVEQRLFDEIRRRHPKLGGALTHCRLAAIDDARITVEVRGSGFQAGLMQRNHPAIEAVCRDLLGKDRVLTLDVTAQASSDGARQRQYRNLVKQEALNHPLVSEAIEIFDGRVVDVRILEGEQK